MKICPSHKRPLGITILSIFYMLFVFGIVKQISSGSSIGIFKGLFYALNFISGLGLFMLKKWGRMLAIISNLMLLALLAVFIVTALSAGPKAFIYVVKSLPIALVPVFILWYLFLPRIKEVFNGTKVAEE